MSGEGAKRSADGGADGKRKKAKYMGGGGSGGAGALPHGSQGILISTDANKDRTTCNQLSDFFTEIWDELCPAPAAEADAAAPAAGSGVDALIAAEVAELKDPKAQRFTFSEAGTKGLAFMRMNAAAAAPRAAPPVAQLVHAALARVRDTGRSRAKFAHRVLPIQAVCFAGLPEILKAAEPLLAAAFPTDADATPLKYAVVFESRACDGLKLDRMAVINALAQCVPQPHSVDLNNPERVIMVQIVKSAAALAVLTDYYALCKYNLRTLITPPEARAGAPTVKGTGVSKPKAGAAAGEKGEEAAAAVGDAPKAVGDAAAAPAAAAEAAEAAAQAEKPAAA